MATSNRTPFGGADPFTALWSEWMKKLAASVPGGAEAASATATSEMAGQMRKTFFDAMSQHADQYMRSDAFLAAMKQSMDNALAWQQMVNQFLQKGVSGAQLPTRADSEHVVRLIRGMEDRLIAKLENMEGRVARLEKAAGVETPKPRGRKRAARSARSTP